MTNEVKINVSCPSEIRDELKAIAKKKGMKFHAFLVQEFEKVIKREAKK